MWGLILRRAPRIEHQDPESHLLRGHGDTVRAPGQQALGAHSRVKGKALTHIVLNIADIEGGGWDCQAQTVFLGDKNGLGETMLFHVGQCELTAWHTDHHVFRAAGKCRSEVTSA